MKKAYIIFVLTFTPLLGFNQNFGAGASVLYNVQTESFGAGARANFGPDKTVSFVPQLSYYFIGLSEVQIRELTLGLSVELKVIRNRNSSIYLLAHGGYNRWLNPEESAMKDPKANNINLEGGIGIAGTRCLRPFLEYRYNLNFRETHFNLGLLYIFGCKQNTGGYRNQARMKSGVKCFKLF